MYFLEGRHFQVPWGFRSVTRLSEIITYRRININESYINKFQVQLLLHLLQIHFMSHESKNFFKQLRKCNLWYLSWLLWFQIWIESSFCAKKDAFLWRYPFFSVRFKRWSQRVSPSTLQGLSKYQNINQPEMPMFSVSCLILSSHPKQKHLQEPVSATGRGPMDFHQAKSHHKCCEKSCEWCTWRAPFTYWNL